VLAGTAGNEHEEVLGMFDERDARVAVVGVEAVVPDVVLRDAGGPEFVQRVVRKYRQEKYGDGD